MKKRRARPGELTTRRVRGERDKRLGIVVAQPSPSRSAVLESGRLDTNVKTKTLTPITSTFDDDVSIDELQRHVEGMFRCHAKFIEAVEVRETYDGAVVWEGAVKVFALDAHPSGAKLAYAWSTRTTGMKRRFRAVLGVPPIDSAVMAVRASILADEKKAQS